MFNHHRFLFIQYIYIAYGCQYEQTARGIIFNQTGIFVQEIKIWDVDEGSKLI